MHIIAYVIYVNMHASNGGAKYNFLYLLTHHTGASAVLIVNSVPRPLLEEKYF